MRPDSLNFNPLLMVWQQAQRLAPVYYTLVSSWPSFLLHTNSQCVYRNIFTSRISYILG